MQYRKIGRTGKEAGIIGLGCEHLDRKPYEKAEETIRTALEHGINYFDVFMPGREVRENIAKALGSHRQDVFIQGAIGSTDVNQQYDISRDLPTTKKYFEECLRIFGGYIDFGMLFFVDSEEDYRKIFDGGIADYVQRLREKGHIRHIGFSSHNPEIAKKVVLTGLPEIMMFSINLAFDLTPSEADVFDAMEQDWAGSDLTKLDAQRTELYALCEQRGVGISVMKTLGAGKLISPEHTPFSKAMTVNQCIHYALSRPGVFTTLLGCESGAQVEDALRYLDAEAEDKDYTPFLQELPDNFKNKCVYCSHCLPCPVEIDIAALHKYLDIAKLDEDNIPPSIRSHYHSMARGGDACIACGSCETRCPFDVPIIENMEKAAQLFKD